MSEKETSSIEESKKTSEEVKDNKNKKNNLVIIILILLILILLIVLALVLTKKPQQEASVSQEAVDRSVVITEDNVEDFLDGIEGPEYPNPAPLGYDTKMNADWNFTDGTSGSYNAYVENVDSNTCSVIFDLYDASTHEVYFESPILTPGSKLTGDMIKLNKDLEPGTYNCVCEYSMLTEDNINSGYTVSIAVTVTVEN